MSKKPGLYKRTGKSSLALRNFLNNLKENDLHYENKQITQCVFLGVLRLKPVPSVFSKNVPSVSAAGNKTKNIKHISSNSDLKKDVSRKNNINKVLNGKVSKKDPQRVKAAIKKVPIKKPNIIKIKLSPNKKTNKDRKVNSGGSNDKQVTITSECLQTITPDSILTSSTLTLNPIMTKFNPVQNLFDKLKQKIDESHCEPGPSTITKNINNVKEWDDRETISSKVCKINANRQFKPLISDKKSKKTLHRRSKPYERLSMPLKSASPITISDTESSDNKYKEEVIVIDEINGSHSNEVLFTEIPENNQNEDIIVVNDALESIKDGPDTECKEIFIKNKDQKTLVECIGRSPNSKKNDIIVINDEYNSNTDRNTKLKVNMPKSKELQQSRLKLHSNEIILISDDINPANKDKISNGNRSYIRKDKSKVTEQNNVENDVIIIDDRKQVRVSPRFKHVEVNETENVLKEGIQDETCSKIDNDAIIMVDTSEDTLRLVKSKASPKTSMLESNVTINDQQKTKNASKSQKKKEFIQNGSHIEQITNNEKPNQRRSRVKPALIPPMLLNTPMLLRSELAPKKTTSILASDKSKSAKAREKSSRLLRSERKLISKFKTFSTAVNNINFSPDETESPNTVSEINLQQSANLITTSTNSSLNYSIPSHEEIPTRPKLKSPHKSLIASMRLNFNKKNTKKMPKLSQNNIPEIELISEETKHIAEKNLNSNLIENINVDNVLQQYIKENTSETSLCVDNLAKTNSNLPERSSSRLLRSDMSKHNSKDEDVIVIKQEFDPNEKTSPRSLRSDCVKSEIQQENCNNLQSVTNQQKVISEVIVVIEENESVILKTKELSANTITKPEEEIIIIKEEEANPEESAPPRILRSSIMLQKNSQNLDSVSAQNKKTSIRNENSVHAQRRKSPKTQQEQQQDFRTSARPEHIDLDEISIVKDKKTETPKERSSRRLLRSELTHQNIKEKSIQNMGEEVVVLIHDEPKPKEMLSSKTLVLENSQKVLSECSDIEHKNNVEAEVILIDEETNIQTRSKSLPSSIRLEEENNISENLILSKDINVLPSKKLVPPLKLSLSKVYLLNNVATIEQMENIDLVESENSNSVSKSLKEQNTAKSLLNLPKRQVLNTTRKGDTNKSLSSSRLMRSDVSSQRRSEFSDGDLSKSYISSSRVLRSDTSIQKCPKNIPKQHTTNIPTLKAKKKEQVSSRHLRSETTTQDYYKIMSPIVSKINAVLNKDQINVSKPESSNLLSEKSSDDTKLQNSTVGKKSKSLKPVVAELDSSKNASKSAFVDFDVIEIQNEENTPVLVTSKMSPKRNPKNDSNIQQKRNKHSEVSEEVEKSDPVTYNSSKVIKPKVVMKKGRLLMKKIQLKNNNKKAKKLNSKIIKSLVDADSKVKSPMLLRSELAQIKHISENTLKIEKPKKQKQQTTRDVKSKKQSPKVNILSDKKNPTIEEAAKQKSLIADLKKQRHKLSESIQNITKLDQIILQEQVSNTRCHIAQKNHCLDVITKTENTEISKESTQEENKVKIQTLLENEIERMQINRKVKRSFGKKNTLSKRSKSNKSLILEKVMAKEKKNKLSTKKKLKKRKLTNKRNLRTHKNKTQENGPPVQEIKHESINNTKKVDITVFDFDESEPELVPLRLSSTPKKDKNAKPANKQLPELKPSENITLKTKRRKLTFLKDKEDSETKAEAKAKLISMFNEEKAKTIELPKKCPKGKSTKTNESLKKTTISQKTCDEKTKQDKKSSPLVNTSPSKRNSSPLKQTTIKDMFNRVHVKNEKAAVVDSVFGSRNNEPPPEEPHLGKISDRNSEMPPPKTERHLTSSKTEKEANELCEDDDSDCDSRMEWIPEEYAEYKFKYSAKKMMSYKPIHKCKICLLILPTFYKLSKHKEEHAKKENPYNCFQCDQAFPNVDDLTAHLRMHKGKHPYTCKKCDAGFWSKKSLDAHTPIHVLKKAKQPNKRFRCDVCGKEFGKLCDIERHTRVHTGEKPCVCNICNKRFQQSYNLSKHLLTHLHVKPFNCEICNKQFGRNDVLNRHLLIHSLDKPLKCAYCPKGFIRPIQLNHHMKKNHPDKLQTVPSKSNVKIVEAK